MCSSDLRALGIDDGAHTEGVENRHGLLLCIGAAPGKVVAPDRPLFYRAAMSDARTLLSAAVATPRALALGLLLLSRP